MPSIDTKDLAKSPPVVGAMAILAGLVLYWFGSLISMFQHFPPGYVDFRDRLLRLLAPGDAYWAVAVLLVVALLVLGSPGDKKTPLVAMLYKVALAAGGLVVVAAVINAILSLTYIGTSINAAFGAGVPGSAGGFFIYLAAVPIAGAAVFWAWQTDHK
jgi:hypothetical protein